MPRLSAFHLIEYYVALRSGETSASGAAAAMRPLPSARRAKLLADLYREN